MSILDWIGFGKVSAERDDLLSAYFFDNGVLKSVMSSPSSFLVLGRKGAGKTAVFRYLTENSAEYIAAGDVLVSLSLEDYNWNIHSLLTNETKAESLFYKQSWRFVILVECVKALQKSFKQRGITPPKGVSAAAKLLEKLFDSPIPSIYDIIGRKLLSLSRLKLPGGGLDLDVAGLDSLKLEGGEVTFEEVHDNVDIRRQLSQNIENLIGILDRAISEADASWPTIVICFDRIDEGWDDVSFESSRRVIAGLVSACDAINGQYKGKLRPLVFLREDIFDVLAVNDANKLREDCGALLHWDKKSLTSLILTRVNYFATSHGHKPIDTLDAMFDKPEMRQRARPSNYIIRRTMMRPRDLIALLNRTVASMREKSENAFAENPITYEKLACESIYDAEPGYSEWLKQELLDEWRVQQPVIESLLQAIQNNSSTNVTQAAFQSEFTKLVPEATQADVVAHIRFLFDNSIIGFKLGASQEWRFKCFYPSQGFVQSDEYRVHEGLVRALNLTEPRDSESTGGETVK